MIKFFRKIRQKLLNENRFSKYLIYAVGEIALVMIGILLALQVNNWNELRKKDQAEIQLYNKIIADLNTERTIIEKKFMALSNIKIYIFSSMVNHMENQNTTPLPIIKTYILIQSESCFFMKITPNH